MLNDSSGHRSLDSKTNGLLSKVIKNGVSAIVSGAPTTNYNSDADLEHLKVNFFFYFYFFILKFLKTIKNYKIIF